MFDQSPHEDARVAWRHTAQPVGSGSWRLDEFVLVPEQSSYICCPSETVPQYLPVVGTCKIQAGYGRAMYLAALVRHFLRLVVMFGRGF